jgi:hypothetical protein
LAFKVARAFDLRIEQSFEPSADARRRQKSRKNKAFWSFISR